MVRVRHSLLVVTMVLVAIGCGEDATDRGNAPSGATPSMTVSMREMRFEPETIRAAPGEDITIELTNDGAVKHNFSIEAAGIDWTLDRNDSGVFTFTAPSEPGEYRIVCDIPGHETAGMVGTLIVE
jgi:nitrite reductase (NO-forming)